MPNCCFYIPKNKCYLTNLLYIHIRSQVCCTEVRSPYANHTIYQQPAVRALSARWLCTNINNQLHLAVMNTRENWYETRTRTTVNVWCFRSPRASRKRVYHHRDNSLFPVSPGWPPSLGLSLHRCTNCAAGQRGSSWNDEASTERKLAEFQDNCSFLPL